MALLFAVVLLLQAAPGPACPDVATCRAQAEAAAARGDYEASHDLAWRAVQKGPKNDKDLMFLLARAQSLSGRPDDALVMLERIVSLGGKPDVANNPDFARVRQLPRYSELATALEAESGSPPPRARVAEDKPAPAAAVTESAPVAPTSAAAPAPAPMSAHAPTDEPAAPPALSFDAPAFAPVGFAHDAVSRRFVVGDRESSRLFIIDEVSRHVVNYASAATAGFFSEVTGFAIDARRGDLWVTSTKGSAADAVSTLHKLQLVSGRTLMEVVVPDAAGATRLADVAVTPDGTAYTTDETGARLFRARPGARRLEQVMRFEAEQPTAVTAADDRVLYVATKEGLLRVDLAANTATRVKSVEPLTGFVSLAWRAGSLIGVERVAGSFLVVRIPLDASGIRAQPRAILAASTEPTVGTLTSQGYYYLLGKNIRFVKVR